MRKTIEALVWASIGLLFAAGALAQQPAHQPLGPHKCGHGHFPPCPPPPPSPPVPVAISFDPAMPSIIDNAPVGTLLATISVTMSDGSAFAGSLGFGAPNSSDGGICAIAGSTVILGALPPLGPAVVNCTITATQ